ncbi:MAG TPA: ATP-binding cassette domain-containing protein [Acetobacteraceae bacterium]|jgi:putative ABC transport system ATP-binding protein|nr:ATP-binding cassette domain-containing protein [Acetobacteraceae bacterium]
MLRARGLTKRFLTGANEIRALDGIDLEMRAAEFVTVIGSNGAGKSTLLKAICGLVEIDGGAIALDGRDVTHWPVHRRGALIGRIAQDPQEGTCATMTVVENLAMAARRGQPRRLRRAVTPARRTDFRAQLATIGLGLEDRLDARVGTLSGGQRQALSLLMATAPAPKVLLLDEHLASLDPRASEIVMSATGRLIAETGIATLMVTHNMAEAIRWGNRLIMLHAGRIVFEAAGAEKGGLTIPALVSRFHAASGQALVDDRVLLASRPGLAASAIPSHDRGQVVGTQR